MDNGTLIRHKEGQAICNRQEDKKSHTRQRVRSAGIPEGTVFYHAKPRPSISDAGEKAVAVYARVSTASEEQVSSIENQTRYYTEKINKTPDWTLQKIYADEGKSGTSIKKRTEFKRMIEDAAAKKMDLILCASVSRFARNMSDCIEQIGNLKTANPSHPVGVYFETENIYTLDPDCSQALSIHAMLADWESDQKSRRMILSYDQRICTGQFPVADLLGYRHSADGSLTIVEDEALTVRFIFLACIYGYSYRQIARILSVKGRKTLTGRTDWNSRMVGNILQNERRWGDLKARKTIVVDYKKGKKTKNNGIREGAFVPNHHEGIVTPQIAKAAHMAAQSRTSGGLQDLYVIDAGRLKGFVSIHPGIPAVDRDALTALSRSAFDDTKSCCFEYSPGILIPEEQNGSAAPAGYYAPHSACFIGRNTPALTVTCRRLKFAEACRDRLPGCKKAELLYHPLLQILILRDCRNNTGGFLWTADSGTPIRHFSAKAFCKALYQEMGWPSEGVFRFRGITRERGSQKALIFFLDEPRAASVPVWSPEQNRPAASAHFCAGMNYSVRKKRDSLINSLEEADIAEPGRIADNPLIGKIPHRDRLKQELEEILTSMER